MIDFSPTDSYWPAAEKILLRFSLFRFLHMHEFKAKNLPMKNKPTRAELEEKIRQLEAQLAESNPADHFVDLGARFYHRCIESAPYGIMIHDEKGRILAFNSRLEKITGYQREEIPDIKTWIEKLYPDKDYRKLVIEERKKAALETASEEKLRKRESIITTKAGDKNLCKISKRLLYLDLNGTWMLKKNQKPLLAQGLLSYLA